MLWLLKLLCLPPLGITDVVEGLFGIGGRPNPPDYNNAAQQTSDSSIQTALINAYLNRPNESTPYGTRMWNQTGSTDIPSIGGQPGFSIPQLTSSTNFSPAGQKMFDLTNNLQTGLLEQGGNTIGQVRNALSSPLDFSGAPAMMGADDLNKSRDQVTNALFQRGMSLLQPQFDTEDMRTKNELINKGFSDGNEGYKRALDEQAARQGTQKQNLVNTSIAAGGAEQSRMADLNLNQRRQSISEILAQRQMPLSELSSLMTGGAPTAPQFQPFATGANASAANYLGAAGAEGQNANAMYALETQRANAEHQGIMDIWKMAAGGAK